MTVEELASISTLYDITTSYGDDLTSLVYKLYPDNIKQGYVVLKTLNQRTDWYNLPVGSTIYYLSKDLVNDINI